MLISFLHNMKNKSYQNIIKTNFFLSGPTYNNNLSTLDEYDFDKVMFISGKLPTLDIDEYEYEKNIFLNVIKYCEKNL